MRARKSFAKKNPAINLLHLLSIRDLQFVLSLLIDKQCLRSLLSPTNEMQFTDRKKFFTDPILLLRSVRIDEPYITTLAMKIF